jgi:hypothetical protein
VWDDFWATNTSGRRKKKSKTREQVRNKEIKEEINEYSKMFEVTCSL